MPWKKDRNFARCLDCGDDAETVKASGRFFYGNGCCNICGAARNREKMKRRFARAEAAGDKARGFKRCRDCGDSAEVVINSGRHFQQNGVCSDCTRERNRATRLKHEAAAKAGDPTKGFKHCYGCGDSAEVVIASGRRFYGNGYCNVCGAAYHRRRVHDPKNYERIKGQQRAFYQRHKTRCREDSRQRIQKRKQRIVEHYGGKCACCGESEVRFLCIDHPNGDGAEHRRIISSQRGATHMYDWLEKNGLPEGFRVLCFNCNMALGFYGECPHGNIPPVPMAPRIRRKGVKRRKRPKHDPAQLRFWETGPRRSSQADRDEQGPGSG